MIKKISLYYKNNPWLKIVILFIFWRIAIQLIVWWADVRFGDGSNCTSVPGFHLLREWAKWDAFYYHDLATRGYQIGPFFPLFPFLIKVVNIVIGNHQLLAASIVTNLATLGSCLMLYKIAKLDLDEKNAQRAVFFLLIFPASFFLVAHYTESLFLFLILCAFYFVRTKKWWFSAPFGFLASITRATGILILPSLLVELILKNWHKLNDKIQWKALLPISFISLGLISFMLFLGINFNRPLAFIESQPAFGRQVSLNVFHTIKDQCLKNLVYREKIYTEDAINAFNYLLFFSLFLTFVILLFKYSRPSYAVLGLSFFVVPAFSGTFISMNRFLLVLFPIYILLAKLIPPNSLLEKIYIMFSFSLSILLMIIFTNCYWVG